MNMDLHIFRFINFDLTNGVFDLFFPFWTDIQKHPAFIYGLLPLILAAILLKKNWKLLGVLVLCGSATWFTDNINHHLIKPQFQRPRPQAFILRVAPQKSTSFPSSHAADAFCFSTLLSLIYPRRKKIFIFLATLSAFARIYCGVHYPSDVLAGALIGTIIAIVLYRLINMTRLKTAVLLLVLCCSSSFAGWTDPTQGKAIFPWVWEDQIHPTLKQSVDKTGLTIAASGAAASIVSHQYDGKVFDYNEKHPLLFGRKEAVNLGRVGNGSFGIAIALTQVYFDQDNGLRHARALLLASLSHMSLAYIFQRERPNHKTDFLPYPSSFPSGHTAAAFATAGSLAYAYGWTGGVPAYLLASAISVARIRDERHWTSDIVAGAVVGTFWARASYSVDKSDTGSVTYVPTPVDDGLMLLAMKEF